MKLNYKKIGETGQPILILHGLFGSLDNWISIARSLSENNYTVYVIDQRNHGQSPHSEEFDYSFMADDLKEFIQEHKIEKPILIGHSMGGKTVMQFACKYPEIPEKIIIVDISPREYPVHHQGIIDALLSLNLKEIISRNEAEMLLSVNIKDFAVRQFLLKNLYRTSTQEFSWRFNLLVLAKKIAFVGEALSCDNLFLKPALFMGGTKSEYTIANDEKIIRKKFPLAQIEMIQGAGHWIHAEAPDAFVKTCKNFLS